MPARESILSLRHPLLKQIRRALDKAEPTPEGYTVVEGRHLLEEARRGRTRVEAVLAPPEFDYPDPWVRRIDVP